ncbi:MAG: hypothetical protein KAS32_16735 [Candidatus Peribacteraceae bacterium]|nr:hypothetical protein [Candidatus Peribacteraceae bacterium]
MSEYECTRCKRTTALVPDEAKNRTLACPYCAVTFKLYEAKLVYKGNSDAYDW